MYAGRNAFAPKLCEYGGNTFGVGSSSVLGQGWPREPVKVEGESVTFSFQVKSSRERATQDNAVWGFNCTITAKVSGWGTERSGRGRKHYSHFHWKCSSDAVWYTLKVKGIFAGTT